MKNTYFVEERFLRAEKKVENIKGFYIHLFWYVMVNLFISISKILSDLSEGTAFDDSFFEFATFAVWIFWGIGILSHWFGVFGKNIVFSKEWEERKMKEFLDNEKIQ